MFSTWVENQEVKLTSTDRPGKRNQKMAGIRNKLQPNSNSAFMEMDENGHCLEPGAFCRIHNGWDQVYVSLGQPQQRTPLVAGPLNLIEELCA